MTDNKLSATFHPQPTPSPDDLPLLDRMEADGVNFDDIHGLHKGAVVTLVLLVAFWASLGGYIVWVVMR